MLNLTFTGSGGLGQLEADYTYDVASAIVDDADVEEDEGFVLYFNFNGSQFNSDDYSRLRTGIRTILVIITNDDGELAVRLNQELYI